VTGAAPQIAPADMSVTQHAAIDATSQRLTLPADPDRRQFISVTGQWFDPSSDPEPAMLDIECHSRRQRLGAYMVNASAVFELPAGTVSVTVRPVYASPAMRLTVQLAPIPKGISRAYLTKLQDEARYASGELIRKRREDD
jgi:hypothetical protein